MTNEELLQRLDQEIDLLHNPRGAIKPTVALLIDCRAALRSPAPGAVAMREAAAKVADEYDCLYADGRGAAVAECQESIAAAIRALPAPEVPEVIQTWCKNYDATEDCGGLDWARNSRLRDHFRKEYGI